MYVVITSSSYEIFSYENNLLPDLGVVNGVFMLKTLGSYNKKGEPLLGGSPNP
jgi:hypothetical protein